MIETYSANKPRIDVKAAANHIKQSQDSGEIPCIRSNQEDLFYALWNAGESVLVTLNQAIDPLWAPSTLQHLYGSHEVETFEVNENGSSAIKSMTVGAFFDLFSSHDPEHSTQSWRIKDWPTSTTFESIWTTENRSFLSALPFSTITQPNGCYNVTAHFARDTADIRAHRPDLGVNVSDLMQ